MLLLSFHFSWFHCSRDPIIFQSYSREVQKSLNHVGFIPIQCFLRGWVVLSFFHLKIENECYVYNLVFFENLSNNLLGGTGTWRQKRGCCNNCKPTLLHGRLCFFWIVLDWLIFLFFVLVFVVIQKYFSHLKGFKKATLWNENRFGLALKDLNRYVAKKFAIIK